MEAELLPVAEVSLGMVTSSLLPAEPRDGSEEVRHVATDILLLLNVSAMLE